MSRDNLPPPTTPPPLPIPTSPNRTALMHLELQYKHTNCLHSMLYSYLAGWQWKHKLKLSVLLR